MAVVAKVDEAFLQTLADKTALRELGMLYARAVDRRDFDLLLRLYTEDGVDDHGIYFQGTAQEFAEAAPVNLEEFEVTAHYILNSLYEIDGDEADGEVYVLAYHRRLVAPAKDLIVGGRYIDRYVRTQEGWKIQRRRLLWDMLFEPPSTPESIAALHGIGVTGLGKEDKTYEWLPLFRSRIHRFE